MGIPGADELVDLGVDDERIVKVGVAVGKWTTTVLPIEDGTAIRMLPSNPAAASVGFLVPNESGRGGMTMVIGEYATLDLYRTRRQSMEDFCDDLVKYATAVAEGRFWEHQKTQPGRDGGVAVVSISPFLDVEGEIVRPRGWAPGRGRRVARTSKSSRQYEAW